MAAITFLNAVSSATTSTIKQLPHLVSEHVFTTLITGSPTAVTLVLEGSIDGTNFFTLGTSTSTSSEMVFVVDKPVTYVRFDLTTWTGGTDITVLWEGDKQRRSRTGRRGQF